MEILGGSLFSVAGAGEFQAVSGDGSDGCVELHQEGSDGAVTFWDWRIPTSPKPACATTAAATALNVSASPVP